MPGRVAGRDILALRLRGGGPKAAAEYPFTN